MGCMKWGFQSTFSDHKFYGKSSLITLQNYYCWGQIYGCSWTLRRTLCCSQGTLRMPLGVFILARWCGCVCQSAFIFLHPNWCQWKILSTDLKPSGKSLWCFNQEPYKYWYLCELFGSIPPQVGPKKQKRSLHEKIYRGWWSSHSWGVSGVWYFHIHCCSINSTLVQCWASSMVSCSQTVKDGWCWILGVQKAWSIKQNDAYLEAVRDLLPTLSPKHAYLL